MKKAKLLFTAMAVVAAVSGAWATRNCQLCTGEQQYYKEGGEYFPAGEIAVDYWCAPGAPNFTCTYVKRGSTYFSCRFGHYTPF